MDNAARGVVVTTDGRAYVKEFSYPLHRSYEDLTGAPDGYTVDPGTGEVVENA